MKQPVAQTGEGAEKADLAHSRTHWKLGCDLYSVVTLACYSPTKIYLLRGGMERLVV